MTDPARSRSVRISCTSRLSIVDDKHVDGQQLAQLGLVRVIETSVLERLEQLVGPDGEHGVLVAARNMSERMRDEGLADPRRDQRP
jgi:hypothetical protein